MKTIVITLPEAKKRQERITQSFSNNNITFEFRNGVEFDNCKFLKNDQSYFIEYDNNLIHINEDKFIENTNRTWMRFGEIAAYIAHYNVWKEFLKTSDDKWIVCEDDAFPQSNMHFLEDIDFNEVGFVNLQTVTAHNQDKKVLYREPFVSKFKSGLVKYERYIPVLCEGLAAYMITKLGAKQLCDYIESNGFVGPNDCMIAKLAEKQIMPVYSPIELEKCFGLDPETNQTSYTHTGSFVPCINFNKVTLHMREHNVFTD